MTTLISQYGCFQETNHKTVIGYLWSNRYNKGSSCFLNRCISTLNLWPDWHWMKNSTETDLCALMLASLNGDARKYHEFLKQAVHPIRASISRLMPYGMTAEADDIIQDVLFAIHQKKHTWRCDQPILPWINAITKYRAIDHMRRLGRQRTISIEPYTDHLMADIPDPAQNIDLKNMVQRLKGQTRAVLVSIGLDGKDICSTAKALGMSENAVRIAFHRGLKKLAQFRQHR